MVLDISIEAISSTARFDRNVQKKVWVRVEICIHKELLKIGYVQKNNTLKIMKMVLL